jgi:hydrogenase maturation factor
VTRDRLGDRAAQTGDRLGDRAAQPGDLPLLERGSYDIACSLVDGCLVCGDVAVPVTVVEEMDERDALCEDPHGQRGSVAIELVGAVAAGDRLLVHGGVAISRLEEGS